MDDPDEIYEGEKDVTAQSTEEGSLPSSEAEFGEDEEEWAGFQKDEANSEQYPPNRVHHKSNHPPTALELRSIKDAADLYRSSSFKLQACRPY